MKKKNEICIVHRCSSHMNKRVRNKIAAVSSDVDFKVLIFCFALRQMSTTPKFALDIYKAKTSILYHTRQER